LTQFSRLCAVDIIPPLVAIPFRVEGLRVTFDIKKDRKKQSNQAKVSIYNLAESTRNNIREISDEILVYAGYRDGAGLELLFRGDIASVSHSVTAPDTVTTIESGDGEKAVRSTVASKSYDVGASAIGVLEDMMKKLGLPVQGSKGGNRFKLPERLRAKLKDIPFLQGFAFDGAAASGLDKVAARLGLEYSIQNGEVKLVEADGFDDSEIPLVTPDSGLIGSPERLTQLEDESQPQAEKKPPGWKIKSLLLPKAEPGGRLAIQSAAIPRATAFRIDRVQHQGDTHGKDFMTTVEVSEPGIPL
jgi:hypothetical protein